MSHSTFEPLNSAIPPTGRGKRRGLLAVASAGIFALLLAACSAGGTTEPTGEPREGGTLRVALGASSLGAVLDPHSANDHYTMWYAEMFYERLVVEDAESENGIKNVLAESITSNDDGSSWTVTLKDDVTFHDGNELTADDVIFSFERILDPATAATGAGSVAHIASMEKVDDLTVRFDLSAPTGIFPQQLAGAALLGIVEPDFDANAPVSTGPWTFESFEPGVDVTVNRYDDYHAEVAKLDSIVLLAMPDVDARTNALLSGQIDVDATLEGPQITRLRSEEAITVVPIETDGFEMVAMRVDQGLTADPRVREAIRLSIDRQQIITVVDGGNGRLANDLPGPSDPLHRSDLTIERDIERAKELMQEAGVVGKEITLTVPTMLETTAQIVAQNVTEAGLNVVLDVKDPASFYGGDGYLQYQFVVEIWGGSDILTFIGMAEAATANLNYTHMNDPELHAAYDVAVTSLDADEREQAVSEIQEILFERGGYAIPRFVTRGLAHPANTAGWWTSDPSGSDILRSLAEVYYTD